MTSPLFLSNSLTHKKEPLIPLSLDKVTLYVCGPTVYDRPHIGNARSAVVFDVLYRLLKHLYENVVYVRNVTDVDDKIIEQAAIQQCSIDVLTKTTLQFYHDDMTALNVLPPTIEPHATDHIPHMIAMIDDLLRLGHAYEAKGHVLFDTTSYVAYGTLSNQKDVLAGARVDVEDYKRNPADFVLWKPTEAPGFDSPFGYGRPGWHIECSAMSKAYLGASFDIHGGGIDLLFPHHENEKAQSCCANQTSQMATLWVHNGHVTVGGSKMSKSLKNFITVNDLLQHYPGEVIRLSLLSALYKQPLDWHDDILGQSKQNLDRFYGALMGGHEGAMVDDTYTEPFLTCLKDDLNIPMGLAYLHDLAHRLFKKQDPIIAASLKFCLNLIGLCEEEPAQWFKKGIDPETLTWITQSIQERDLAKQNKDYTKADQIRDHLKEKGYIVMDSPQGTTFRKL